MSLFFTKSIFSVISVFIFSPFRTEYVVPGRSLSVCMSVFVSVVVSNFLNFEPILLKLWPHNLNNNLRWHFSQIWKILLWWRHNSVSAVFQCGIITPSIATFSHFIDLMYWDRSGQKIPGCLSLCLFVCLSVCLFALERQNYRADFDKTHKKWSPIYLIVCVCVSAHYHNSWHQGRHIRRKKLALSQPQFGSDFLVILYVSSILHLLGLGLYRVTKKVTQENCSTSVKK